MTAAVIDAGSNSIRVMVAEGNASPKPLLKRVVMTKLAEGIDITGRLSDLSMKRSIKAILEFIPQIRSLYGDIPILGYATSAVRDASNGEEFVQKIYMATGVKLEIIDGDAEALLDFVGATSGMGGVIDIGGGSTEIITGDGSPTFSISVPIGCVRARDQFPEETLKKSLPDFYHWLDSKFKLPELSSSRWFCVGGNASTLAAFKQGLIKFDAQKIDGFRFTPQLLDELSLQLFDKKVRTASPVLFERQDIILYGTLILGYLVKLLNIPQIFVSESDNMEGYWISRFSEN